MGEQKAGKATMKGYKIMVKDVRVTWLHLEATVQLGWATPGHGSSPNHTEKGCSFSIFCTPR
jgi:hypothetical protein